jgi:hypothetical protein
MFKRPWIYLSNPFESACFGSYISGLQMSTYLDAALNAAKADAAILVLYNYYHPIHLAYVNSYTVWNVQRGTQIGHTMTLKQLLDGLTPKVNAWDYTISGLFAKTTPTYKSIFPNGYAAFTTGSQSNRIAAVTSLDTALTAYPALATTKTDVHNYAVLLETANTTQKGAKTIKNTDSDLVEAQRKTMALGQMYVYGGLVQKFTTDLNRVGDFFDLQLIRDGKQTQFAGHTNSLSVVNIFKRTLSDTTQLSIKNTGNTKLHFYLSDTKTGAMGTVFLVVMPQTTEVVDITTLGDVTTQHFLNSYNEDTLNACTWEVEIL